VIDDISPLRQLDDAVLASDVHLFRPTSVAAVPQPDDDGTPYQKDEPYADNPEEGVVISYFLKSASPGPVTLEVLDSAGSVVATIPPTPKPEDRARPRRDGIPRVSPLWNRVPEGPLPTTAGMHRVVWPTVEPGSFDDNATDAERAPRFHIGTFAARLTVAGKRYTQTFEVTPEIVGD
jgi:hypothetical protein